MKRMKLLAVVLVLGFSLMGCGEYAYTPVDSGETVSEENLSAETDTDEAAEEALTEDADAEDLEAGDGQA